MTDDAPTIDPYAAGYERHWAPVLAPSARALLERLEPAVGGGATDLIDVGSGTGNLALEALRRWAGVRVSAIDASAEMAEALVALAGTEPTAAGDRLAVRVAMAAELPFDDASFDLAMSSFVLQLVPDRGAALREIHRVLRPGGTLGYVTWLADRTPFPPDRVFDALLADFGFDDDGDEERVGDVPSAPAAARELDEAGFAAIHAEATTLTHAFTVESYLAFLVEFDEESTFEELGRVERRRFLRRLREGLMGLPAADLVFRAPIVYAMARRPGG